MKNPFDVLRMKERQILKVRVEIEALRITAQLLSDERPNTTQGQAIAPIDFDALESALDSLKST